MVKNKIIFLIISVQKQGYEIDSHTPILPRILLSSKNVYTSKCTIVFLLKIMVIRA
nr:MAG TPA: hypothetical protein [Caudoviricetes sp.]